MPNEGNLIPAKKGEPSRNPNGRPKGSLNRSTIAKKVLAMMGEMPEKVFEKLKTVYPGIEQTMTLEEIMTLVQAHKAISKGDTFAYMQLLDSAYGKAKQTSEINLEGDGIAVPAINVYNVGPGFAANEADIDMKKEEY